MDLTHLEINSENGEHHTRIRVPRLSQALLVFGLLFLCASRLNAQSADKNLLPDHIGQKWKAGSPARVLDGQKLSSQPDADVLKEYGLRNIVTRDYTDGHIHLSVEILDLNLIPNAYGLFTFDRQEISSSASEFRHGRYVVRITGQEPDSPERKSAGTEIFEALKPSLSGGEGELPALPIHLPEQDKVAGSEKYIIGPAAVAKLKNFAFLKDAIGFNSGAEVATADYSINGGQASLIIVEYYSPQSASDGQSRIQAQINTLAQSEKDHLVLKRIGEYIVVMTNIQDIPSSQNILGQIKYQKKIFWAGQKFTDIPVQYRPPDPLIERDFHDTVRTLVRSFYWTAIAILSAVLVGFSAGFSLFQWKRYRRRKLGLENAFSDAGGSLRLNLDDYYLPEDSEIKRIGAGDK